MQKSINDMVETGVFKTSMADAGLGELTDVSSIILGTNPEQT
jgi:hypothetical protein